MTIKNKVISLLENAFGRTGKVLEVRAWNPATFFEVDVHFPDMKMEKWDKVQHIKIRVAEGIYRDYTPACWDVETSTCTLFIDAQHEGPGSKWVSRLKKGDTIVYVGVGPTFHQPTTNSAMISLGDMSSIGHYLALQQLAKEQPLVGAITIADEHHRREFNEYLDWSIGAIAQQDFGGYSALANWVETNDLTTATIYITGHIPTCVQLRKRIKQLNTQPKSIKVQGFWQ